MKNYTSTIKVPTPMSGESTWNAVCKIENSQTVKPWESDSVYILFNKGRYFELSCYNKDILRFVSQSAKVKIKRKTDLIAGSEKLEAVVKAFNKKGYYCKINQDWI